MPDWIKIVVFIIGLFQSKGTFLFISLYRKALKSKKKKLPEEFCLNRLIGKDRLNNVSSKISRDKTFFALIKADLFG